MGWSVASKDASSKYLGREAHPQKSVTTPQRQPRWKCQFPMGTSEQASAAGDIYVMRKKLPGYDTGVDADRFSCSGAKGNGPTHLTFTWHSQPSECMARCLEKLVRKSHQSPHAATTHHPFLGHSQRPSHTQQIHGRMVVAFCSVQT